MKLAQIDLEGCVVRSVEVGRQLSGFIDKAFVSAAIPVPFPLVVPFWLCLL
jgi:hypothetical protein